MKIIQSITGGGKTNELAKVAAEYTQKGKKVHFFTDELELNEFKYYLDKNKVDANYLEFSEVGSDSDLLSKIFDDTTSEALLIDVHSFAFNSSKPEEKNLLFKSIEKLLGKSVYLTKQVGNTGHLITTEI